MLFRFLSFFGGERFSFFEVWLLHLSASFFHMLFEFLSLFIGFACIPYSRTGCRCKGTPGVFHLPLHLQTGWL